MLFQIFTVKATKFIHIYGYGFKFLQCKQKMLPRKCYDQTQQKKFIQEYEVTGV